MSTLPENMSGSGKAANENRTAGAAGCEVPIDVCGSIEAVTGDAPQLQPFQEHTNTVIVSPEKGVFSLATPVSIGQVLLVTNLKSEKNAFCRVIDVRKHANGTNYVEVEFTTAVPEFWGVDFEPHIPEVLKRTVSETSSVEPPQRADSAPVRPESSSLAPRNEASNIGIIELEDLRRYVQFATVAKSAKRKAWLTWKPIARAVVFVVALSCGGFFHLLTKDTLDLKPLGAPAPPMLATKENYITQ